MKFKRHHQFMLKYSKKLIVSVVERPAFMFLGALAATLMTFFSLIFYWVENGINPQLHTFLDSAYFTVSNMTSVGSANIYPHTEVGKVLAMMMMLLGTFIYVSFTGVVASTLMEIDIQNSEE